MMNIELANYKIQKESLVFMNIPLQDDVSEAMCPDSASEITLYSKDGFLRSLSQGNDNKGMNLFIFPSNYCVSPIGDREVIEL